MASYAPIKLHEGMTDLRSAAYLKKSGQKGAYASVGNKYAAIAKNPGKSMWDSFTSIFGFGQRPHKRKPRVKAKPKPKRKPGRPKKKC